MQILVVEDDPDIRDALEQNLADAGYVVSAASSAAEALRLVGLATPDLVLLDLMLPDRPGREVCRALRGNPHTRTVPIIIVSALTGEEHRVAGLEWGADDYIQKPFSMRELLLRIEAVVKRSHAEVARSIDGGWAAAREEIRVWQGFSANHFERGEWRDCQEISRTILRRYAERLSPQESALLHDRIRRCDARLGGLHDSALGGSSQ